MQERNAMQSELTVYVADAAQVGGAAGRDPPPPAPGCLLGDVRMPGMSGLELQELLAARKIALPVIVITGHGHVAMAVRAMKVGAADFIEKPFDNEALLECIRKTLARAA